MASVELKGLGKRCGQVVAIDNVSLRIEHGPGFIEPSAGEIVVGDRWLMAD